MQRKLEITLLSDTTFGRGDGIAGLVDVEVEHGAETGLPYISGRRIKGLLVEACSDLMYATGNPMELTAAARLLFGSTGSSQDEEGRLRVGRAELPADFQQAVRYSIYSSQITSDEVLNSLTTIRRQTAIDAVSNAPKQGSLRSMRAVIRNISFVSILDLNITDDEPELERIESLLVACAHAVQRGGLGRNRGRGRLRLTIESQEHMASQLAAFATVLGVTI